MDEVRNLCFYTTFFTVVILYELKPYFAPKLYCTWNNLSKFWNECHKKLEDSLEMALHYQDMMQVRV